jgi:hypothetical protein
MTAVCTVLTRTRAQRGRHETLAQSAAAVVCSGIIEVAGIKAPSLPDNGQTPECVKVAETVEDRFFVNGAVGMQGTHRSGCQARRTHRRQLHRQANTPSVGCSCPSWRTRRSWTQLDKIETKAVRPSHRKRHPTSDSRRGQTAPAARRERAAIELPLMHGTRSCLRRS